MLNVILYFVIFYIKAIVFPPCVNTYDYSLPLCNDFPCYLNDSILGILDSVVNNIIPVVIISIANLVLLIRVSYKKWNKNVFSDDSLAFILEVQTGQLFCSKYNIQNFTNLLRIIGSNRRGSYPTHIAINNNLLDLENSFSNYCYNDEFRNLIYEWIKELNLEFNKLNIS